MELHEQEKLQIDQSEINKRKVIHFYGKGSEISVVK